MGLVGGEGGELVLGFRARGWSGANRSLILAHVLGGAVDAESGQTGPFSVVTVDAVAMGSGGWQERLREPGNRGSWWALAGVVGRFLT